MLMRRYQAFAMIVFMASCAGGVQMSRENAAMGKMGKGKWSKAHALLRKEIKRDSLNPLVRFVFARYFFDIHNPEYQIDSAYAYVMDARAHYTASSLRGQERLHRFPLDSLAIDRLRERIDSAAFARAKMINTEQAYLDFLDRFQYASQRNRASELRDEAAYLDAMRENTYQSYRAFLEKYPDAYRATEARQHYDLLLFEAKTKDGRLASFESFLEQYPETPYRRNAEKQIFEISTGTGEADAFVRFIRKYPSSEFAGRARGILYHLNRVAFPPEWMNDSLRRCRALSESYLVPFAMAGKFGFMDMNGNEVLAAVMPQLGGAYRCGQVTEELVSGGNKLVARNGTLLFEGSVDVMDDLGSGYVMITSGNNNVILHLSGFRVPSGQVQDARMVGSFLAIQSNQRWSLWSLTGRRILGPEWDEVSAFGDGILLTKGGRVHLSTPRRIAAMLNTEPLTEIAAYDEVRLWPDNFLWVRRGRQQGILKQNLTYWIPVGDYTIEPAFCGLVAHGSSGTRLFAATGRSLAADTAVIHAPWIALRQQKKWLLTGSQLNPIAVNDFDSLSFRGPLLVTHHGDSISVYTSPQHHIALRAQTVFRFLAGKDSTFFVEVVDGTGSTIYNWHCARLFAVKTDHIEYAGENLFRITRKNKVGLVNSGGNIVLPVEFDAIGSVQDHRAPVLRNKMFGYVDLATRKEVKPVYEKNLVPLMKDHFLAFKDGRYGMIDWLGKEMIPFEFEEITTWNDTSFLVKRNFQWMIYGMQGKRPVMSHILDIRWIRNTDEEKIAVIRQDVDKGVISSRRGVVVPVSFSDIINLGSAEEPLYFTDKFVEEAGIHVVIYYDRNGNMLRRSVLEANDFEELHCNKGD